MTKYILASFALLGFITIEAQENITLNIRLKPLQTLMINNIQHSENLNVTDDVNAKAVYSLATNYLTIHSTEGYKEKLKNSDAALRKGRINRLSNALKLKASAVKDALNGPHYAQETVLSSNEKTWVTATGGVVIKKIIIMDKSTESDTYLGNYISAEDTTVQITEHAYTIIAP
jgi:hypothetical protein